MTAPTAYQPGRLLALVVLGLVLFAQPTLGQEGTYGAVDFPVSCASEAQASFDTGLALLHHMMYEQAAAHFETAAEADDACAMAHWGVAMTQLRPLWAPPTEAEFRRGRSAIEKARALEAETERERAYVDALATYYTAAEVGTHRKGVRAWETAQRELHDAHVDDVDAAAFWALAHLATAPSDDSTYAHQKRAGAVLEARLDAAPRHPGLFHYLIHAYDNPVLSENAVDVARAYDKLAPDVPHALHMPSHIFVRLGVWPDVIEWNRRSADVALRQSPEAYTSLHHAHALDYMIYAYLQRGQDQQARAALNELLAVETYQPHPAAAYGIAAAQARYALERRQWDEAAALPLGVPDTFPWEDFPEHEAITYWARGLGAVRSGDLSTAQAVVDTLEAIHERTLEKREEYWALHVEARRTTVQAWIAQAEGNVDRALTLMRTAADLEDSVDKHPITPSAVLPARELLGDLLMAAGRPDEALAAYRTALNVSPNRFNSLYGAGRAAEEAGLPDVAKSFYGRLVESTATADSDREAVLTHARAFLGQS
jgi:tetratricopeptide (TPR) repeat protein